MGRYEAGKLFEGAEWSPDRKTTWGNKGGKDVGKISADVAAKIVEALGMSVPKSGESRADFHHAKSQVPLEEIGRATFVPRSN